MKGRGKRREGKSKKEEGGIEEEEHLFTRFFNETKLFSMDHEHEPCSPCTPTSPSDIEKTETLRCPMCPRIQRKYSRTWTRTLSKLPCVGIIPVISRWTHNSSD